MDKFTIYIAIYGALLSTLVFVWDIIKQIRDKPRLIVRCNHHMLVGPSGSKPRIGVTMINEEKRPVTIVASGFKLKTKSDKNMLTIADQELPKEITEGQSYTTFANYDQIDSSKILYAWVRTATDKVYRSEKYPLRP